jgi:hypothetical protein
MFRIFLKLCRERTNVSIKKALPAITGRAFSDYSHHYGEGMGLSSFVPSGKFSLRSFHSPCLNLYHDWGIDVKLIEKF